MTPRPLADFFLAPITSTLTPADRGRLSPERAADLDVRLRLLAEARGDAAARSLRQ